MAGIGEKGFARLFHPVRSAARGQKNKRTTVPSEAQHAMRNLRQLLNPLSLCDSLKEWHVQTDNRHAKKCQPNRMLPPTEDTRGEIEVVRESMTSLTTTERRVLESLTRDTPERRVTLRGLRLLIRLTAYHEAGHVVARMFTGLEFSHVVRVSVVPDDGTLGRETTERCTEEATIEICPSAAQKQSIGRRLLIALLAGRGAIACLSGDDSRAYILRSNPEEWAMEGSDLFRAYRVAGIIAGTSGDPWHALEEAEEWTTEMLDMPVVWQAVRRLAGRLIKDGSIEGGAIMDICDKVLLLGLSLPEWQRRLHAANGRFVPLGQAP